MSGTEWTEPGQGATGAQFKSYLAKSTGWLELVGGGKLQQIWRLTNHLNDRLYSPTNLRLTGEPLTAEDLKRIAEAK